MTINFEFTTKYGVYKDALILPDDHTFTDQELIDMQNTRLDNWLAVVEAASQAQPEA